MGTSVEQGNERENIRRIGGKMSPCVYGVVSLGCPEIRGFRGPFRENTPMSDQRDSDVGENAATFNGPVQGGTPEPLGRLSPTAIEHLNMRARLPGIAFPERSTIFVYVIGEERGPVKIGVSCNPLMRMRDLQTSTPRQLTLLAFVPGSFDHEKALHAFYARERLTGEWFRRSKRLREFIDALNNGWMS